MVHKSQRPYKSVSTDARRALKLRRGNSRIDLTITRERIMRPYGSFLRSEKEGV